MDRMIHETDTVSAVWLDRRRHWQCTFTGSLVVRITAFHVGGRCTFPNVESIRHGQYDTHRYVTDCAIVENVLTFTMRLQCDTKTVNTLNNGQP